jgi:hydrogenase maturation protease
VAVVECAGDVAEVVAALAGATRVVLVDAADFGGAPGSVRRLDVARDPLPVAPAWSSHGPGLAAALELARRLGSLPPRCVVLAVQAGGVAPGAGLSPAVAAAVAGIEAQARAELLPG